MFPKEVLSQLGADPACVGGRSRLDDQKALTKTVRTYPKTAVYDLGVGVGFAGDRRGRRHRAVREGGVYPGGVDQDAGPALADGHHRPEAIAAAAKASPLQAEHGQTIDRDSAHERLAAKLAPPPPVTPAPPASPPPVYIPPPVEVPPMPAPAQPDEPGPLDKMIDSPAFKSAMRSAAP